MISFNNFSSTGQSSSTYKTGAALLVGGQTYMLPWIPTARPLTASSGASYTVGDKTARTATTCFIRGLKEKIQVQTNSGVPWQWRRIVVRLKGDAINLYSGSMFNWYQETSNGIMRNLNDALSQSSVGSPVNKLLWQGSQSVDWSSYFTAKVDNNNVTVMYDKTRIISSGNASGVMRNFNMWHGLNKNLVYADDEAGDQTVGQPYSTAGKAGCGDMYIFDIIAGGTGSSSSDQMTFDPEATLYWHER